MWQQKTKQANKAKKEVKVAVLAGRANARLHVQVAEAYASLLDEGYRVTNVTNSHMNAAFWMSKFVTVITAERDI